MLTNLSKLKCYENLRNRAVNSMDIAKRRVCDALYNMLQQMWCAIVNDDRDSPGLGGTLLVGLWQSRPTFKIFRLYS